MTPAPAPAAAAARPGLTWPPQFVPAALGVALVLVLLAWSTTLRQEPRFSHFLLQTDFPAFLTGAHLIASGQGAHLYDPAVQAPVQAALLAPDHYTADLLPYNHLPFLAIALTPLTGLPLAAAYAVWLAACVLALAGALVLLGQELRAVARGPAEARWAPRALVALSFGFFPVYQCLLQVQTAPWDLLGATLLIRYLRQEREVAAGLALGLLLVKPQLLLVPVLVLLYERRWRVLGTFTALGAALAAAVTPLLGGPGWILQYLRLLGDVATVSAGASIVQPSFMENLRGFFILLAGRTGTPDGWALPATALASLAVLAALLVLWRRAPARAFAADPTGWDTRWAAALLATLLVDPHAFAYELVLLLLPGVLLWRAAREPGHRLGVRPTAAVLAVGYVAAAVTLPILAWPEWPLHVGVLALAGILGVLLWVTRRPAPAARAAA